jgi:Rod binding domain-containing protein
MTLAIAADWARVPTSRPALGKTENAARDFEAMLLTSLLDSLEKTFCGASDAGFAGADDYRLMGTQALAAAVAAGGGIGIARLILRHMEPRHIEPTKVPGVG